MAPSPRRVAAEVGGVCGHTPRGRGSWSAGGEATTRAGEGGGATTESGIAAVFGRGGLFMMKLVP